MADSIPVRAAYSVNDALQAMSIGRTLFYREVAAGRIVAKKVGRKTIVPTASIERWLNSLPQAGRERARAA